MTSIVLLFLLASPAELERLTKLVIESGRVLEIASPPSERVAVPPQIAPGPPPLLSFRLLEAQERHRFGGLDLVMDDAGH